MLLVIFHPKHTVFSYASLHTVDFTLKFPSLDECFFYLTVNLKGAPMAQLPDVVGQGSLRQAVSILESLGFKLTPHEPVLGRPKDLVIAVKQGRREVHAGQMLPRDQKLTIVIGGGEIDSTMMEDEEDLDVEVEDGGNDFDIEL